MIVKNNYDECLTNLACSIQKYFGLEYKHNTLDYVDEILKNKKPKNIVTILCDGMGSNIIDRMLEKDSFLVKNRIKPITTVFPATTVAATTSMMTGLNPVETGMLGWFMYYKDIDEFITTFIGSRQTDKEFIPLKEAIEYRKNNMRETTIMESLNNKTNYKGYTLFPFGENPYKDINDMFDIIENKCNESGEKYIYAYNPEPDSSMHEFGCDSNEVKKIIVNLNDKIEDLSKKVKDTIIFVVADHGHINVKNIDLNNYPDIVECFSKGTSLETRTINFFIKEEKKNEFEKLFNKLETYSVCF